MGCLLSAFQQMLNSKGNREGSVTTLGEILRLYSGLNEKILMKVALPVCLQSVY